MFTQNKQKNILKFERLSIPTINFLETIFQRQAHCTITIF